MIRTTTELRKNTIAAVAVLVTLTAVGCLVMTVL